MARGLGFQKIVGLPTATALTLPAGASYALIIAEGTDVRWRDDGVDPTPTTGMLLVAGNVLRYDSPLFSIKFIETAATATLSISYY